VENDDVLREAGPKARILDCSCGLGTFAISLAKLGYEVSGSDGRPGMIEQANLATRNAGVNVPLNCCTWEELPTQIHGPLRFGFLSWQLDRPYTQLRRNVSVGARNAGRGKEWRQTRLRIQELGATQEKKTPPVSRRRFVQLATQFQDTNQLLCFESILIP
jgi:hypothetical protein